MYFENKKGDALLFRLVRVLVELAAASVVDDVDMGDDELEIIGELSCLKL